MTCLPRSVNWHRKWWSNRNWNTRRRSHCHHSNKSSHWQNTVYPCLRSRWLILLPRKWRQPNQSRVNQHYPSHSTWIWVCSSWVELWAVASSARSVSAGMLHLTKAPKNERIIRSQEDIQVHDCWVQDAGTPHRVTDHFEQHQPP